MRVQKAACLCGCIILLLPLAMTGVAAQRVVLVTGFEPFGSYEVNPSQLVAEALNGTTLEDAVVVGIVLPVDFTKSVQDAKAAIEHYHPDVVLSLGLAARSKVVKVEKIAVNLMRYPRDDGTWSFPKRIDKNGPMFRVSPLDSGRIARSMRTAGIPAQMSAFAGTYICNALLYGLLDWCNEGVMPDTIGFIHVPLLDSQDPEGMNLETLKDAVKIALVLCLEH